MNLTICDEEIKGDFRLYSACKYKYWLKSYESMYFHLFWSKPISALKNLYEFPWMEVHNFFIFLISLKKTSKDNHLLSLIHLTGSA